MNYRSTFVGLVLFSHAAVLSVGCATTARDAWASTFENCGESDVIPADAVYFGPSNPVGPGSVWRRTPSGSLNLRWLPSDLALRPSDVIVPGKEITLKRVTNSKNNAHVGLLLRSALSATDPRLDALLANAHDTDVSIRAFQVDQLNEGPFEQAVRSLDKTSPFLSDIQRAERFVMVTGVKVTGFEVTAHFSSQNRLDIAYAMQIEQLTSTSLGAALTMNWTDESTLKISTKDAFYIAGELARIDPSGALGATTSAPMLIRANPTVTGIGVEHK